MDFSHGTNNLGYHLAASTEPRFILDDFIFSNSIHYFNHTVYSNLNSLLKCTLLLLRGLVVTTATGGGFPVVDFICLNEYAITIKTILKYFKEKNAMWTNVKSVVIDKDVSNGKRCRSVFLRYKFALSVPCYFVLEKCHEATCIKVVQSEELLNLMTKLLYCRTENIYNAGYDALKLYCKTNQKQAFFAYFKKNWNLCRGTWSNIFRGKHFTARNTTTNRIESNWNQLKMLLGLKTRIDKTVSDLLQHQMTITLQISTTLYITAANICPYVLEGSGQQIVCTCLEKVKREWENIVNRMEKINCELSSSVLIWKVYCSNNTFTCHDVDWTWPCLFFTSNHFPCCHLMHVADKGHEFKMLPAMSIRDRWSTFVALNVKDDIAAVADALRLILSMSKLNQKKIDLTSNSLAESRKQVAFVRLHRYEKANQVVLSFAENYSYAKAMLEPLLQHLCELSSAYFYQELNAWKETVDIGLQRKNTEDATKEDVDRSKAKESGEITVGNEAAKADKTYCGFNSHCQIQCYVLSSLTSVVEWPSTPKTPITATKIILHPVNLKANHWSIIITKLRYNEAAHELRVHIFMYEPLIDEEYREDMEMESNGITNMTGELVKEGLRGFVERWCQKSSPNIKLHIYPIEWVNAPQLPDVKRLEFVLMDKIDGDQ
ncbi:LOW QUALITY PROTEIN: Hypothetical protein PHPALM_6605 [Phytophthora palmivora]|uniref:Uncharacterized protein n=1 Tax=Phytophthora palmivora TaxID=4796 RepID=A0A2P4YED7_9STRA|nr:LOW QUALITY PROTEIN: Hypothetical protein PHPALM_6605 [Phytophthora palmivora]